jgi:Cellulase (glycosyl hydrolase family 5)
MKSPRSSSKLGLVLSLLALVMLIGGLVLWNFMSVPNLEPYAVSSAYAPEPTRAYGAYYNQYPNSSALPTPTIYGQKPPVSIEQRPTPRSAASDPRNNEIPSGQVVGPVPTYGAPPTIIAGIPIGGIPTVDPNGPLSNLPMPGGAKEDINAPISVDKPFYSAPVGPITVKNGQFVDGQGARVFLAGVNYEGSVDRAWVMWNNDMFDLSLIDKDFKRAVEGGYNTIRMFVQTQLRDDILRGDFSKLDKVVELARKNGIFILLTFADYGEGDINSLVKVDTAVAQRYVNDHYMFGYDLKNEPNFNDVMGANYPAEMNVPLQTDAMVKTYGERTKESITLGRLSQERGYYFANANRLYQEYLEDAAAWTKARSNTTSLDYMDAPESAKWKPFLEAASGTLQAYIDFRMGAIRKFDKDKPVTIGWNNTFLGRLASNRNLSFVSIHRYAPPGASSLRITFAVLDNLKKTFANVPVVFEEFGYSNIDWPNRPIGQNTTAGHETAVWLYLYGRGFGGGYKWMLNNFSKGANPIENNYGLLDNQNNPKPAYGAARAVLRMAHLNRNPSGDFNNLDGPNDTDITYFWTSGNAFFGNSPAFNNSRIQFQQDGNAPWAVYTPNNGLGQIYIATASNARVSIDLKSFFPTWSTRNNPQILADSGSAPSNFERKDNKISFVARAGDLYTINIPILPAAFSRATPIGGPNSLYFNETGHNVSNAFKNYWQQRGGQFLLGLPISEEFQEGGYLVQYFERARLEYRPEFAGTSQEVQLGRLGSLVAAGRKDSDEKHFKAVNPFESTADRVFVKETGHSVSGGFKIFWEKYGGVNQFGFPISEEFEEKNPVDGKTYVVQYFERARFEFNAAARGTPNEVQLGLLGTQVLKARGWIQ